MKKFVIILLIVLVLLMVMAWAVLSFGYSNGVRTGRLVKISQRGFLLKTYEGTLDLGSGDQLTWSFSVHDDDIGEKLAEHSGEIVRLKYKELLYSLYYGTQYDIISFEKVRNEMDKESNFCRFVNVIRTNAPLVNSVKEMVMQQDPSLITEIRKCPE